MKMLAAAGALTAVLLVAGCSSAPSQADACGEFTAATSGLEESLASASVVSTPNEAASALEPVAEVAHDLGGIQGPDEFMRLRDEAVDGLQGYLDALGQASAGEGSDWRGATDTFISAYGELLIYCS